MYRKCVTEVSVRHQKQVEQSLLALMQKMTYEEISVTQLSAEAGISRRVFYHLFNSKADALYALIDHTLLDIESYRTELSNQPLRFFLYWREQKPLLDALGANAMTGLLLERMIESVLREDYDIRYLLKANGWEEEQEILVFNLSGIMGLVYSWYCSGYEKSPGEMAVLLERILTRPLAGGTSAG